ncbi:MAG: hypothetical protein Q7T54_00695 [Candidatus Levybacteria bacterium]|nr:hypothetical protein [Candidatus Levybacteria bacterium]
MSKFFFFLFFSVIFLAIPTKSYALFDPLSRPNNFNGIHILFPSELSQAAHLVNSKDGEWGYVTIPIQAGDKDMEKWQIFMDEAKKLKLIPIVRLATQADIENTAVWAKPTTTEILDFANFLNSLNWPVENRYIIVYNEMNRFDEWGGEAPNPREYADMLSYAVEVFKDRNPNFYIIMGGLDNASPNDRVKYMDNLIYIREMAAYNEEIFNKIDAFSSHSYPNPGFTAPPLQNKVEGVTTYQFEYKLINSYTVNKKPVFITETGWDSKKLSESVIANYYKITYENFWNKDKDKIVAITPFLLNSQGGGAFDIFSFVKDGRQTQYYTISEEMEKTKGEPLLEAVKGIATEKITQFTNLIVPKKEVNPEITKQLIVDVVKVFF